MIDKKQHQLPKKRLGSLTEQLDKISVVDLIFSGFLFYFLIAVGFSIYECKFQYGDNCINNSTTDDNFGDILYFNLITILTIGYGDYSPTGYFRILSIVEAIMGLVIFSLLISLIAVKSLLPRRYTIVFSKFGYYSKRERRFMIIYLNTAKDYLINSEICSYVKTGGDWLVTQAVRAPFITNSVQTFFLNEVDSNEMKKSVTDYDCLRVGITGNIGIGNYSTKVEYNFKEIIVIDNRELLSNYNGFWLVDNNITKKEFAEYFHYNPKDSKTLYNYLRE